MILQLCALGIISLAPLGAQTRSMQWVIEAHSEASRQVAEVTWHVLSDYDRSDTFTRSQSQTCVA
jgi:hypothetical protein